MFLLVMGVGGLVTAENKGTLQRIAILTTVPWMSLGAYSLLRFISKSQDNLRDNGDAP